MTQYTKFQEAALLALRLILAVIFIYAGIAKFGMWTATPEGMSSAMANMMKLLSIVEPLGGVAVLVGLLTRWASAGLAIIMVRAFYSLLFTMNAGFMTPQEGPGAAFPLMVFAGLMALMAFGPGRYSVEAKFDK